jgi:hypothetical protein
MPAHTQSAARDGSSAPGKTTCGAGDGSLTLIAHSERCQVCWLENAQLGNHRVDAIVSGQVRASEEELELQPSAEADDHGVRNITSSSGISIGQ